MMEFDAVVRCPKCGRESADMDDWDVIGACNGNLFCQVCHCEFDPSTGAIHKCRLTEEEFFAGKRCE